MDSPGILHAALSGWTPFGSWYSNAYMAIYDGSAAQTIALQYQTWSKGRGRAVTEIAKQHGVKVSTASRWVAAARDRNFLPRKKEENG